MLFSSVATLLLSSLVSGSILGAEVTETKSLSGFHWDEFYTFDKKFALAVKEYCSDDKNYNLVYENDCGEAVYSCDPCQTYPKCDCLDCYDTDDYDKCYDTDDYDKCYEVDVAAGSVPSLSMAIPSTIPTLTAAADISTYGGKYKKFCEICDKDEYVFFTLCNTVLKDECDRTGEIACNHELKFVECEDPKAIYDKGFSIKYQLGQWLLALNHKTLFWSCKVDEKCLFKIYDKKIACHCEPIELIVIVAKKECCDVADTFATFTTTVLTTTTV
ncbi:unnamed protein product [Candida verbasci]|uniref:Cell wall mannoprotein PIR1-like C-terminal domain-containing protein n=1 Tax=Candida verbasci TaxID=1227364 RepID=A0A9W4XJB0_9ASCO|nr:unnamed protein product [Candida verbasci]